MNRFLKIFLHHLFLAITAMLMMKQTLSMRGVFEFDTNKYFIVFLSTILIYQLAAAGVSIPFKRGLFYRNNIWISLMLALLIALLFFVMTLNFNERFLLFCISLGCFGYIISIGSWKGLRAIPAIKGSLLALVWSMVTVVFPLINHWNWNTDFCFFTATVFIYVRHLHHL